MREWATDLTLALLLQGAEISKLATSDEETGYHVALHMCCQTGMQIEVKTAFASEVIKGRNDKTG